MQVGTVSHTLKVAGNDKLELYDFPGGYAQRFDGITPGGSDRSSDIQNIFQDNERTAAIRMQQEAARALSITGKSTCRQFTAGHKFTLDRHFNANGVYVLTQVGHSATMGDTYTTGSDTSPIYENTFECIPVALPFKPAQATPRPRIEGTQTAVVVGNPGDEIFTDKYGRVKVQFPWDRQGKKDADSSCWVRVATLWGGKNWGMIHIPRVGQEVVVSFEEGDPDRPLIVGSVYNAEQMPAFELPKGMVVSGYKSNTHKGKGYNELTFNDTAGKEMITMHGQYDMSTTIEHDQTLLVKNDRSNTVKGKFTETITKDTKITIEQGPYSHDVAANTAIYHVNKDLTENYDANQKTTVGDAQTTRSRTTSPFARRRRDPDRRGQEDHPAHRDKPPDYGVERQDHDFGCQHRRDRQDRYQGIRAGDRNQWREGDQVRRGHADRHLRPGQGGRLGNRDHLKCGGRARDQRSNGQDQLRWVMRAFFREDPPRAGGFH